MLRHATSAAVRGYLAAICGSLLISTAALAQAPFRIGVLNDQAGPYAEFGGKTSVEAAKMAVEDFGGKVLGRPIEVLSGDHQNKADIASALARKWFDVDGVSAVADMTNSAVALAVSGIAKERGRVTLATGPATTRLTNEDCSPTGFHWAFDTYSQAAGMARAVLASGGKDWYLLTADYAFGHQMAADITRIIKDGGGSITGESRHPLNTNDFSSFLLAAQSSKAQVVGLANAGSDTINSVKQASEFQLTAGGKRLVALVVVLSDVHALGLPAAQGLSFTTAFYWDRDDASREWSKRFMAKTGRMPGMIQAGVYSSVMHYLKAVQAAGADDGPAIAKKMRETPVDDFFAKGKIRDDGRFEHDMYLAEVKKPNESKGPWDYFRIIRTIPAADATQPLSDSKCALVKK
ncbi:hypothetical protein GJW-30_1_00910 [Variibacter gotjawalensis]|uniref:Leucine-binding protein domain-containing protein n=1 Tax=Variibacter gotjawalensis TaxID=1333996 RepID=A0A0S3PQZ8_9BRAD|nr:ABC transporter substrate-binding protein [Variibacter gotjawalensis]NIK48690.1 branched-chain amino acid transport system substrate-binding protein [Variibacter gotjawalensis]RZS50551.1 amino acid/amide ABC transporter substrate-binding protein (HAAT family) [Variibacter gotjawalensis]BAT58385.1 hypothetical protein GJW-30_1_00910 [Variibacter gotjawalensis]